MNDFILFAKPLWVNLLIFVPLILLYYWKNHKLEISKTKLFYLLIFGIAFGIIEASCVVYLRAAIGLLPGYHGTLFEVWSKSNLIPYNQELALTQIPASLLTIEIIREIGTILMLGMVALISAVKARERVAIFLWIFATWDIVYYIHLWIATRWPQNLTTPDVLFLVPEPWVSQVWFPILISILTMVAVLLNLKRLK